MIDDIVYVDVNEGSKRVMNNVKLYVKLITKFKDDQNILQIEAALSAGEMEKAQNITHTLKGLTANLSLSELYKQCLELESQLKAGSFNPDHLERVKNAYSLTITEIDKVVAQYA